MQTDATIYDVARLSGVSTATVSRAFSSPERVRESTRKKIYEAAEVLHYHPNAIARAMSLQRTDKIAYLICKQGATILDEFYAGICEGIMSEANRAEYQLLIATAEDWRSAETAAQRKQIEGVILGGEVQPEFISELQGQGIATVLANNDIAGFNGACILSDEYDAVRLVVDHLIGRGHRHIGILVGRINAYITRERYNAFMDIMRLRGLPVLPSDVMMCEPTSQSAQQAALQLLQQRERPTAVVAINDVVAAGVMKAARQLGLEIPRDLAVTGIDDSAVCTMLDPELTSVHINCRRMGELCVERLRAVLNGEENIPRRTVVPAELVVRRSS